MTSLTTRWLIGPSVINDVELEDGRVLRAHGVKVERCRFLEEAGCAAVCLNCCKLPTQEFFAKDMGIALEMTPNYDDYSCQFSFGKRPAPENEGELYASPCFAACPSKRANWDAVVAGGSPSEQCQNVDPDVLVEGKSSAA